MEPPFFETSVIYIVHQVCSLKWSKTSNELVSTHGFSPGPIQNQVCLWKYPSMQQIATLSGHTYRGESSSFFASY